MRADAGSGDGMSARFTLEGRVRSFGHALRGIRFVLRTQPNAWIHAAAAAAVIVAGLCFGVTATEWGLLVLATTVVLAAEAINTALELLADVASPEFHPLIGHAKDVAAAAVLVSALGAAAVGLIVLGPYCLALLR
jgi:diacylglycerol kinase (ATP)